jgi:hypothetical protein
MKQWVADFVLLGLLLWLIGYLASLALFFSPFASEMGWILLVACTPVAVAITYWRFRGRVLPLAYYAKAGLCWMALAIVLDYIFIVLLFTATYYGADVFVYYVVTFLVPVCVGMFLNRCRAPPA